MTISIERLGLIIAPDTHPGAGNNINGPCCIEVPDWCPDRLGRFYLYFADHSGSHIKFAYSDKITGPWLLRENGVLNLSEFRDAYDHIASPDIVLDAVAREWRLYFHARSHARGREQWTFAASSSDGLNFRPAADQPLAAFYLKLFKWRGQFYGISKGGNLWRSTDGLTPFEPGGNPFDSSHSGEIWRNDPGSIRHVGLNLSDSVLTVYFSRIGDAPERILRSKINLSYPDWKCWVASPPEEVLRPEAHYEGGNLPLTVSVSGPASSPENALRDPHILAHLGENYMFYSVCADQ